MVGYILNELIVIILIISLFCWFFFAFPNYNPPKIILPTITILLLVSYILSLTFLTLLFLILLIFFTLFFIFKSLIFPKIRMPTLNWNVVKMKLQMYGIFSLIIILIIFLLFHIIEIVLYFQTNYRQNLLFTLLNSLLFGVFLAVLGLMNKGIQNKGLMILALFVLICFFIGGFGFMDFKITFNLFFFHEIHNTYSSGGVETGNFMLYNIVFFVGVLVISFFVCKKKGVDK